MFFMKLGMSSLIFVAILALGTMAFISFDSNNAVAAVPIIKSGIKIPAQDSNTPIKINPGAISKYTQQYEIKQGQMDDDNSQDYPSDWDCVLMYEIKKMRTEMGLSTDSFLMFTNICKGLYPHAS